MTFHKTGGNMQGAGSVSEIVYKPDVTLGDYIHRKQQSAAFDDVKPTFDEWFKQFCKDAGIAAYYPAFSKEDMKDCWIAAGGKV